MQTLAIGDRNCSDSVVYFKRHNNVPELDLYSEYRDDTVADQRERTQTHWGPHKRENLTPLNALYWTDILTANECKGMNKISNLHMIVHGF